MQFVGSQARAEELAQDVFLQAYRARGSYKPRARFATWLFRIATNACLSELRRPEQRGQTRSLDQMETHEDSETRSEFPDPESVNAEAGALGGELRQRILSLLDSLPPQQRAAIILARAEGFSYEEVAASLDTSVAAVKSLIHRATVALREGLKEYLPEEDL
jgi:RNA polymerase sigma-70 factor (ECF subfamily)